MTNPSESNPFATPDAHQVAQNEELRQQQEKAAWDAYAAQQAAYAEQQAEYARQTGQAPPQWTSQQWQGQVGGQQHSPYQQNPYQQNPYQQNPYQQNPYQQNPYQQSPYGASPHPPQYAAYPQRPATPGVATAALVLGIISVVMFPPAGIVALILGIIALRRIARLASGGRGMAIAGLITGSMGTAITVFLILAFVFLFNTAQESSISVNSPRTIPSQSASIGHCLDVLPETDAELSYWLVPCSDPHLAGIVTVRPTQNSDFPATSQEVEALAARCLSGSYTARKKMEELGLENFQIFAVIPDEDRWDGGFDANFHCLVTPTSGYMQGSLFRQDLELVPESRP